MSLLIFKGDASDTNYTKERKRDNDASSHVITRHYSFFCNVNARCDRASSSVTGWKSDKEGLRSVWKKNPAHSECLIPWQLTDRAPSPWSFIRRVCFSQIGKGHDVDTRRCKCLNPRSIRKKLAGTNVTQESRSLTLGSYTVNQGNQHDTVWQAKSPVSCNPFDVVHALLDIRIRILCGGKRRFLTGRGGQRTRVDSIGGCPAVSAAETAGPTPDDLEPRIRLDSTKPSNSLSTSFLLSLVLGEGGLLGPGGVLGPQMGAGLLEPDRVTNPGKLYQSTGLPLEAYALPLVCRPPGFSLLIRARKLDQAGIDGVGEHRSKHCVPQSERRWVTSYYLKA